MMKQAMKQIVCALLAVAMLPVIGFAGSAAVVVREVVERCDEDFSGTAFHSPQIQFSDDFAVYQTEYSYMVEQTYRFGAGENEIVWDFGGTVKYFYIQLIYDKQILRDNLTPITRMWCTSM